MPRRLQQAFTLTEAMIATMILGLVFASVLSLAAHGFRYLADLRSWARSSQVLQQKMEDIRLVTQWSSIQALNNSAFTDQSIAGELYNGRVVISDYSPPYPTNIMARVTLTVNWTNSVGRAVTNRLSSLVSQDGLNSYIF